jgi:hypothetical protein
MRDRAFLKPIDYLALVLVIVGALNWLLVGLFEFDLVAEIVGEEFGEVNLASRIIYILVGLAGLWLISLIIRAASPSPERRHTTTSTTT